MKEIKECSVYELDNFSNGKQIIKFTEKQEDGTFNDGTTNEEVVSMLIERFFSLQKKNYSVENKTIIILLKNIRKLLATRYNKKKESLNRYEENSYKRRE